MTRINIQYNLFVEKSDKLGWSTGQNIKNRGPVSQQVWHDKDPFQYKSLSSDCFVSWKVNIDWLIDWIVFYAVSAISRPYNGDARRRAKPVNDNDDISLYEWMISERDT